MRMRARSRTRSDLPAVSRMRELPSEVIGPVNLSASLALGLDVAASLTSGTAADIAASLEIGLDTAASLSARWTLPAAAFDIGANMSAALKAYMPPAALQIGLNIDSKVHISLPIRMAPLSLGLGMDLTSPAIQLGQIFPAEAFSMGLDIAAAHLTVSGTIPRFVAVGSSATAAYSDDGISWTSVTFPTSGAWRQVAFSSTLGRWVAVGGSGSNSPTVIYSDDNGVTWNNVPGFVNYTWYNVTWFDDGTNKYFSAYRTANGTGFEFCYSADGINWTVSTSGGTSGGVTRMKVSDKAGGGKIAWCAPVAGSPNDIWYSTNGRTWAKSATRSNTGGGRIDPAAYNPTADDFVSMNLSPASNTGVSISDATLASWSNSTATGVTNASQFSAMRWVPAWSLYVAVGYGGAGTPYSVFTSANGIAWTQRSVGTNGVILQDMCYSVSRGRGVAVGSSGKIYYSSDGLTWTQATTGVPAVNFSHVQCSM